jgi:hypothetical protein
MRMQCATLLTFGLVVVGACGLVWMAESVYPKSAASAIVLTAITLVGLWVVRPGWNMRTGVFRAYWLALFGVLLASAYAAAWFLAFFKIPLPYDVRSMDIAAAAPAIVLITGIEELTFRQLLYRWLEQRQASPRTTVVATSLAFSWAHLGPIFIGGAIGAEFFLLQSVYMLWIGVLLGEIRRVTGSWLMSWLGHFSYNVVVLYLLSITWKLF